MFSISIKKIFSNNKPSVFRAIRRKVSINPITELPKSYKMAMEPATVYIKNKLTLLKQPIDWDIFKKQALIEHPNAFNEMNFEVQLMNIVLNIGFDNLEIIRSISDFIQNSGKLKSNRVIISHFCLFNLSLIPDVNLSIIYEMLKPLILDKHFYKYITVSKCIEAYSSKSKDCAKQIYDLIKHKLNENLGLTEFAINAFKFGLLEEGSEIAVSLNSKNLQSKKVMCYWLQCLREKKDKNQEKKFLTVLEQNRIFIFNEDVDLFTDCLNSLGYKTKISKVSSIKCQCHTCLHKLNTFTDKEARQLRNKFERNIIFNKDLLIPNLQEQFAEFKTQILEKYRNDPLNLVIDALNASFRGSEIAYIKDKSSRLVPYNIELTESLYKYMKQNDIFNKFKNILVVGKKHMFFWKSLKILKKEHANQVEIYLSHDDSQDDLFFIYAALQNPNTYFISGDFLRQHKGLLDDETKMLFEKWKFCRQIRFRTKTLLAYPSGVDNVVQLHPNGLHIPICKDTFLVDYNERYINSWICAIRTK